MKKRAIFAAVLAFSGILTLAACTETATEPDSYAKLNELARKERETMTLVLTCVQEGVTLTGTYTASAEEAGVKIDYTFERLNVIEEEGGVYTVPDSLKSTHTGSMTVKDGEVVEKSGEAADISVETICLGGLKFDASYFTGVKDEAGKFSADVKNVSAFMGASAPSATDMKVEVVYTDTAFTSLKLSYTKEGASLTLSYTFA